MKINYTLTKSNEKRFKIHRGMTLLEIVIVIGIIGIILAASIGTFSGVLGGANYRAVEIKIQSLKTVLESYKLLGGTYPTQAQGLQSLVTKPSSAPEPRRWKQQIQTLPIDPWQNEYIYKFPGSKDKSTYEIISKGEDGELGTEDDISSQDGIQ